MTATSRCQASYTNCRPVTWALHTRDGVFWADGRTNAVNAGRHSLGTKDRREAVDLLQRLDLTVAIERGLAPPEALAPVAADELPLDAGRALYEEHAARSRVTGGTRRSPGTGTGRCSTSSSRSSSPSGSPPGTG